MEEKKSLLAKCAATTLSSKLIGGEKEFFATMAVDAVLAIGAEDRLNMIGMKKVQEFYIYFTSYSNSCLGPAIFWFSAVCLCNKPTRCFLLFTYAT